MYALFRPTPTCTVGFFKLGNMPKKIPPECEALVKAFSRDKLTVRAIVAKCKDNNLTKYTVSIDYMNRVIRNLGVARQRRAQGLPPWKDKMDCHPS